MKSAGKKKEVTTRLFSVLMFSSQCQPFHISCDRGGFLPREHLRRSGLLLVMPGCPLHMPGRLQPARPREGTHVWSLRTPEPSLRAVKNALTCTLCIPLAWCPASLCCRAAVGSLLVSKARARLPVPLQKMLFNHNNKKPNKTKKKKKSSSVHKCSDLISEGGQGINPCVDGLKNESEHLVAPVTVSHISYEL